MNYQVILVNDEIRNKNYYYSYTTSDDELGNITTTDLPPYQDINKARSCYWNSETKSWVFDDDKYNEIIIKIEVEESERKEAELIEASTPTVLELAEASMETAQAVSDVAEAIDVLAEMLTMVEERLILLEENI